MLPFLPQDQSLDKNYQNIAKNPDLLFEICNKKVVGGKSTIPGTHRTGPLTKLTERHRHFYDMEPIDMRKNTDMTWTVPYIRQATFGYFKINIEIAKTTTGDIAIS